MTSFLVQNGQSIHDMGEGLGQSHSVDRHFLQTVIETFASHGLTPGAALVLLLVAAMVAVGAAIILARHFARHRRKRVPANAITSPALIRQYLEEAFGRRSKFELGFHDRKNRRRTTFCSLMELGKSSLVVEPPGKVWFSRDWVGRRVRLFFGVPSGRSRNKRVHFSFVGHILDVVPLHQELCHLVVTFPSQLTVSQKRRFLRIAPASGHLGRFFLLPDDARGEKALLELADGAGNGTDGAPGDGWADPEARLLELEMPETMVANLSAGGVGLKALFADIERKRETRLKPGCGVLLYLEVAEVAGEADQEGQGGVVPYLVAGEVRHYFSSYLKAEVGVEFKAVLTPDPAAPSGFRASRLKGEGIEPLADWVMARHLEMFRELGYW